MIAESIHIFGTHCDNEGVPLVRDKVLSMGFAPDNITVVTKATLASERAIQMAFKANRAVHDVVDKRSLPLLGIGIAPIDGVRSFVLSSLAIAGTEQTKPVGQLVYRLLKIGVPEYVASRYGRHVNGGRVLIGVICNDPAKMHLLLPMLDTAGLNDLWYTGKKENRRCRAVRWLREAFSGGN
jgi:hypothetical protein